MAMQLHKGHARMLRLAGAMRTASKALSEEAISAEWHSITAVKIASEKPIIALMGAVWADQRREVLRKLDTVLPDLGVTKRGPELDPLFVQSLLDISTWDAVLDEEMRPLIVAVLEEGFRTGALRVSLTSNFQVSPRTSAVLDEVLLKTKGINSTTASDVGSQIMQGLRDNESMAEISRRVEQYFDGIESWRAQQIAQTSATPAFEVSQQEAFTEAGIVDNTWLTQRDSLVRALHAPMDGETVRIGEPFSNGLLFPGDPSGAAEEVIRCRCSLLPGGTAEKMFAREHRPVIHLVKASEYASTQFNLTGEAKRLALQMAAAIDDEDLADDGRENEPHVTIRFGITDFDVEMTRQVIRGFGAVEITFGEISLFENEKFDVVKLDIEGPRLYELNNLIRSEVPGEDTHPVYIPHMTLAYARSGRGRDYLDMENLLAGQSQTFTALVFSVPSGDGYEQTVISLLEPDRKSLIQSAYGALRDEHGQIAALELLADRFCVSERTVRRDLWE